MGLAPYGQPKYAQRILDNLIDLKPDGSFRLDMSYLDYSTRLTMTTGRLAELCGWHVAAPDHGPLRRAVGGAGAAPGKTIDRIPHGHRRFDPGGARRDGITDD